MTVMRNQLFLRLIFANLCLLLLQKNGSYRFPWKMSSNLSKIFTTNLPNFTEFHQRKCKKIHRFLCSCWRQKISKNFKWEQITWAFILSMHEMVTLYGATLTSKRYNKHRHPFLNRSPPHPSPTGLNSYRKKFIKIIIPNAWCRSSHPSAGSWFL